LNSDYQDGDSIAVSRAHRQSNDQALAPPPLLGLHRCGWSTRIAAWLDRHSSTEVARSLGYGGPSSVTRALARIDGAARQLKQLLVELEKEVLNRKSSSDPRTCPTEPPCEAWIAAIEQGQYHLRNYEMGGFLDQVITAMK
jgi:hypothetical protein